MICKTHIFPSEANASVVEGVALPENCQTTCFNRVA